MPYLVALAAGLLGAACGAKSVDLGHDQDGAPAANSSGPICATTPPPAANDGAAPVATKTPWTLVERSGSIQTFGVDRGEAFLLAAPSGSMTGMTLSRCYVDDCAATLQRWPVADGGSWTGAELAPIAFDGEFAYWPGMGAGGGIDGCPRDDCTFPDNVLAGVSSFLLDGGFLYSTIGGALLRCTLSNGYCATVTGIPMQAPAGAAPFGGQTQMVADQEYLYLLDAKRILRVRSDGSSKFEVVTEGEEVIGHMALSGDSVLWTEYAALGTVKACPKAACAGQTRVLAGGLHFPRSLAADDQRVYFVEPRVPGGDSDRMAACSLSGCAEPTALIENAGVDGKVLVDDRFVYVVGDDPNVAAQQAVTDLPAAAFIAVLPK
jgi:hypothetical protein